MPLAQSQGSIHILSANSPWATVAKVKVKRQESAPCHHGAMASLEVPHHQKGSRTGADHLIYQAPQVTSHAICKGTSGDLDTQVLALLFKRSMFLNRALQHYILQVLNS